MKTTLQILQEARALISDPKHWCVGFLTDPYDANKHCALGAIGIVVSGQASSALNYLIENGEAAVCRLALLTDGPEPHPASKVALWNNTHSHGQVLAWFDDAIAAELDQVAEAEAEAVAKALVESAEACDEKTGGRMTVLIEKLLTTYDDEHLASLLNAAENDWINYAFKTLCLLARHQLGYSAARRIDLGYADGIHVGGIHAEHEFRELAACDTDRNALLVLLIRAEQLRRIATQEAVAAAEVAAVAVAEPELVCA